MIYLVKILEESLDWCTARLFHKALLEKTNLMEEANSLIAHGRMLESKSLHGSVFMKD